MQLLVTAIALYLLATSAAAQEIDITSHLKAIIGCSAEAYDPGQGEFDADEFNAAWESCEPARNALLDALPAQLRPEWEGKLENVRRSMIDRYRPQPYEEGYGLNPEEPVQIGGLDEGPARTYRYFSRLRTSDGRTVSVRRLGSCCRFPTPNARIGDHGVLDKYELTVAGTDLKKIVYVNIYDQGSIEAVSGFVLTDSD